MLYISQNDESDCGFTCLKMLLANINKNENYLYLPKPNELSYPLSFSNLVNIAKTHGVNLMPIKVNNKEELLNNRVFPFLTSLFFHGTIHMVYVYKIKFKRIYYFDPAIGFKNESFKNFSSKWQMTGLLINTFKKSNCDIHSFHLFTPNERIFLLVWQILSCGFCLSAVFFVDKVFPNVIAIVCFVLFAISEIILRKYCLSLMERMDTRINSVPKEIKKEDFREFFYLTQQIKKSSITRSLSTVFSLFVIGFITFLLLYNSLYHGILIGISLLICLFYKFIFVKKMHLKNTLILNQEKKIYMSDNFEQYKKECEAVSSLGNKYGLEIVIEKIFRIVLIILSAVITMGLCGFINPTYIIFYSSITYYLTTQIDYIFNYKTSVDEYKSLLCKMYSIIYR